MNFAFIFIGVIVFIASIYYLGYFAGHEDGWNKAKHYTKIDNNIEKDNKKGKIK